MDLRGPTGERINLTGTWETVGSSLRGGIYYLRQIGSCLWMAGGFPWPDDEVIEELGALGILTVAFRGRITDDFTIHGTWVDFRHDHMPPGQGGTLDLRIAFEDSGAPRLEYVNSIGEPFIDPNLPADELTWVKRNDGGRYPPP